MGKIWSILHASVAMLPVHIHVVPTLSDTSALATLLNFAIVLLQLQHVRVIQRCNSNNVSNTYMYSQL